MDAEAAWPFCIQFWVGQYGGAGQCGFRRVPDLFTVRGSDPLCTEKPLGYSVGLWLFGGATFVDFPIFGIGPQGFIIFVGRVTIKAFFFES